MTAAPKSPWADRSKLAGGHLSDAEVAIKVRMLMRTDPDHEVVCSMGRDRIMHLSEKADVLGKALRKVTGQLKAVEPRYSRDAAVIAEAEALLDMLDGRS
jgi:hypothetical protein